MHLSKKYNDVQSKANYEILQYRLILSFKCRGMQKGDETLGFVPAFYEIKNRIYIGNIAFWLDLSVSPTYAHADHE